MTTFRQFPANLIIRDADIAINVMATHSTFLFQISLGGKTWAVLQRLAELWPQQTSLVVAWANVGYSIVPAEDFQKIISTMLPGLAATCTVNMCGQHCQKPDRYSVSYCAGQEHNSCNMLEKPGHPQNWHVAKGVFGHHRLPAGTPRHTAIRTLATITATTVLTHEAHRHEGWQPCMRFMFKRRLTKFSMQMVVSTKTIFRLFTWWVMC